MKGLASGREIKQNAYSSAARREGYECVRTPNTLTEFKWIQTAARDWTFELNGFFKVEWSFSPFCIARRRKSFNWKQFRTVEWRIMTLGRISSNFRAESQSLFPRNCSLSLTQYVFSDFHSTVIMLELCKKFRERISSVNHALLRIINEKHSMRRVEGTPKYARQWREFFIFM